MITTTENTGSNGRLGNQIIRNLAVSLVAEKHNLVVNYCHNDLLQRLGVDLFSGGNTYDIIEVLDDITYFPILNSDTINYSLSPNSAYFQTKEITGMIYAYLQREAVKANIIEKNPFKDRYNANNDLYVHVRLADAAVWSPGITYYINTINAIEYDRLYISTDEKDHTIIQTLLATYPNATLLEYDEITTFQYASTCKHIVLSHGAFSAIIGYIAYFSNVNYPAYGWNQIMWYGDIFSIQGWTKIPVV